LSSLLVESENVHSVNMQPDTVLNLTHFGRKLSYLAGWSENHVSDCAKHFTRHSPFAELRT